MKKMTFAMIEAIKCKFDVDLLKLLEDESVLDYFADINKAMPILEFFFGEDIRNNPDADFDYLRSKAVDFLTELSRFFPPDKRMLLALVMAKTEAMAMQLGEVNESMTHLLRKSVESISSPLQEQ